MLFRVLILAVSLLGLTAMARADGAIAIKEPYARATIGQAKVSAAYMTIEASAGPDRLIAVASPVAGTAELHTHLHEGGVMKMRQVEAIEVAPGKPAKLETGGLHIMLLDLKQPLKAGETIPLTLTFEKAGKVEVQLPVRPLRQGHQGH